MLEKSLWSVFCTAVFLYEHVLVHCTEGLQKHFQMLFQGFYKNK